MISDLALSALWFSAGAAAAWKLTALHYRSRLSEATTSANLFKEWWIRDSAEMLVAKAQLDLIHQQHVDAGRKAHAPWKALRRETTEKLMQCVVERQLNTLPAVEPATGNSCAGSAAAKEGEPHKRGSADRTCGASHQRSERTANRSTGSWAKARGNSSPAETTMKGA